MVIRKIDVRNTSIVVDNYEKGDSYKIEHFFSLWDKTTHRYYPKAIKFEPEARKIYLPRGIDISRLELLLNAKAGMYSNTDPFDEGIQIRLRYAPRDDIQKKAIQFILGRGMYSYTRNHSQLAINLNTGSGKTYVSIVCAAIFSVRTMMITSSLDWINQWKEKIVEYTDTKPNEIYILTGIGSIARILNGMVDISKIKYILASHMTLKSFATDGDGRRKTYHWERVAELFKRLRIGLKVYDEAHLDFDNICDIDFATNTAKTLYLTATPARSDPNENRIYQEAFKNVPSINLFNKETDPRTNYTAILYNSHPNAMQIQFCQNQYGFSMINYCTYIIHQPAFYMLISGLMEIIMKKGKTLIYIGTNEAILAVYNWIVCNYPEMSDQVGIYTSLVHDKVKKQEALTKHIILSTTKSCGAAMDIPGLRMTIVLAEPFKSEVIAAQSLGRTRAYGTDYIEIVDRGFRRIEQFYRSKQKLFNRLALSNRVIHMQDEDIYAQHLQSLRSQSIRLSMIQDRKKDELITVMTMGCE